MFWKNFKLSPLLALLLIIGISNGVLSLTKSPILAKTKHIAISPLSLVFDSPFGIDYWTYTYNFTFETNQGTIVILGDKKLYTDYRRGWFSHIFIHYFFSSITISDDRKHSLKMLENLACTGLIQTLKKYDNLKIYKVHLSILDGDSILRKERSFLCQ